MIFASSFFCPWLMRDTQNLSDNDLLDMLSRQTTRLTRLLVGLFQDNEYLRCKELINALTTEIEARKNVRSNQTATSPDASFKEK